MTNILYFLRPAIVSMILIAGVQILRTAFFASDTIAFANLDYLMLGIFALSLFAMFKFKTDPIKIMLASGVIYLLVSVFIL